MSQINFGSKIEDIKVSSEKELLNSLLTPDGCGIQLKKEVLITLLRRHFNGELIKIIEREVK